MSTAVIVLLALSVALAAAFVAAAYVRRWEWAGFAGTSAGGQGSKTVWDWLQLLVIPLGLAAVAFALNVAQSSREQRREDRRAALERSIASDRRREDALGVYLQQMSDLMLDRGLLTSREGSESRAIARTLTRSVLRRLDSQRKGFVIQFLSEARLIDIKNPKISMSGVDLRRIKVRGLIERANLDEADLTNADFRGADIANLSFSSAHLRGADFSGTIGIFVSFDGATLEHAKFSRARFTKSSFEDACMSDARFDEATLAHTNFTIASGHNVDFSGATLEDVNFLDTELVGINSTDALLRGTRLPDPGRDPSRFPECVHG